MPSSGAVGDARDNATMESLLSSVQSEILDRKRWTARIELSNAMFEYIKVRHQSRRRPSKYKYASFMEYERTLDQETD